MGKKSRKSKEERVAKLQAKAAQVAFVRRPYEGLHGEADLVAMRELVPAATATVKLTEEHGGEEATVATLLPAAWQAMRRNDGKLFLGLQTPVSSSDLSRDAAAALLKVADSAAGTSEAGGSSPGTGPRLQDILDPEFGWKVTVHETFDYWLPEAVGDSDYDEEVKASLDQANETISPTERLASVESAYWTMIGGRTYLRWALTDDEEKVLDAFARLHNAGKNTMGEGSRYLGCFRAHGIVVPVWELEHGTQADDVEEAAKTFDAELKAALAEDGNLNADERRARAGVVSRQLTLR
ncbi:DUF5926 family protein [Saxibacter everestensis]|uniref:DUF5926 family protein n=1 Tax=Saxibacter everestensis TaxID=2909229 RepID=A0ABY8QST3_9MICO|nr:DUF5926 family protein [Brevibacteriaceae bacterium ZFBP1038]